MKAFVVAAIAALSSPALADECRFFSDTGPESITPAEEDGIIILHTAQGSSDCTIDKAEAQSFWVHCADSGGVVEVLSFFPEGSAGEAAFFRGKWWHWQCFQPT